MDTDFSREYSLVLRNDEGLHVTTARSFPHVWSGAKAEGEAWAEDASSSCTISEYQTTNAFSPVKVSIIHAGMSELLYEAQDDLSDVRQESQDEGYPTPSAAAMANARRLLLEMHDILPRRFEVYPTQDGEIAIDAPAGHGRSVILLCDSDGGALCLVNNDGDQRRARYSNANKLPDGFLREALDELKLRDDQAA